MPHRSRRIRRAHTPAATLCSLVLVAGTVHGVQDNQTGPVISGRSFSGIDLPSFPQAIAVDFSATRAWTWTEGNEIGGTDRLVLEGDVRVGIGGYQFTATRAVVWIEPVEVVGSEGRRASADQLAVYFENVRDPGGRPGPEPGVGQSADRLLVTGLIVRQAQGISLRADTIVQGRPSVDRSPRSADAARLNLEGEARLAKFLASVSAGTPDIDLADRGPIERPARTDVIVERVAPPDPYALADEDWFVDSRPDGLSTPGRLIQPGPSLGTVTFSSPEIVIEPDDETGGYSIMFTRGVGLSYELDGRSGSRQLTAERAVVFLQSGADAAAGSYRSTDIAGIYLEGDVNLIAIDTPSGLLGETSISAERNRYTLRGSRVYYDLRTDRAVLLDAVFWTYDASRGMPLYLRAESIRKEADAQFSAERATLANVAFADPHFSIGADSITLSRRPRPDGSIANHIAATGVGFRAGDVPLLKVPRISGELRPTPLRRIGFESEGGDPIVRTEWDLYSLLGVDAAPGNTASLLVDGYLARGVGLGGELSWDTPETDGRLFGYYINDSGTDRLTTGERVDRSGDHRGIAQAEGRYRLDEVWSFFGKISYVSDEAFVDAFFRREAETGSEFISSLFVRRVDPNGAQNTGLTLDLRASLNDFIINEHLLQSPGYQTERLPELSYYSIGADLFGGSLTYYGQTRAGVLRLNLADNDLREQGFTNQIAQSAFGINADQTIADQLRSQGFSETEILRFDSRHEIEMPLAFGSRREFNLTPFATGRVTAYDTDFDEFRDAAGVDESDRYRLWGAVGARFGTSLIRVDDSVSSGLFDLTRMRHIIEPSATVWFADSTTEDGSLPIYDDTVEGISDGLSYRVGFRNTWQTKRGPRDAQRSVDWLVIDTNYTWSDDDTRIASPFGRFVEFRPETSNFGEFVSNQGVLLLTDAVALTGDWLYDTDENRTRRVSAGALIDHGFGYSSYLEYRSLDVVNSDSLQAGTRYELTRKYAIELYGTWDLDLDEFHRVGSRIERRFPQWTFDFGIDYNNIEDNLSIGVALRPVGFGDETRTRVFTREADSIDTISSQQRMRATRLNSGPFSR